MEKPLVTLLLPCYNCEKTLDRFMRSVISESYRPLELICIDGGSTDDTAKLLKNFEESKKMMKRMQGMAKFASKGGFRMPFGH